MTTNENNIEFQNVLNKLNVDSVEPKSHLKLETIEIENLSTKITKEEIQNLFNSSKLFI